VPQLPRARDHAGGLQPRSCRLHVVPRRVGRAYDCCAGRLRKLPRRRAEVRTRRPSALRRMPRTARREADAHVRVVSREQDQRATRQPTGRMRELSSPTRPGWSRRSARLHDLPRAGHAPRPARRLGPRGMRELPRVASRAATRRPSDLHGRLPHEQARPPARCPGLHWVSRVQKMRRAAEVSALPPSSRR
jgi:hypothetical protein